MLGLLAPTLLAVIAALAVGGSLRQLARTGIRWWPAIIAVFALELVLYNPPIDRQPWALAIGPGLWLVLRLGLLAVLIRNAWPARGQVCWPWLIAASGVGLNTLVIGLNAGHMPQSAEAAVAVWGASRIDATRLQNVIPIGPDTRLAWLGDVIPEPGWFPGANVISVGDILLAVGIAAWTFGAIAPSTRFGRRIIGGTIRAPIHAFAARTSRRCST